MFAKKHLLVSPIAKEYLRQQFWYLLDKQGIYAQPLKDAQQYFNIIQPINLMILNDDYYETFCFAGNSESIATINFYVNNQGCLEKFCTYFMEKVKYKTGSESKSDLIEKTLCDLF